MTTPAPLGLGHSGRTQGASRGTHEVFSFFQFFRHYTDMAR